VRHSLKRPLGLPQLVDYALHIAGRGSNLLNDLAIGLGITQSIM
jgi:hypothetical protein